MAGSRPKREVVPRKGAPGIAIWAVQPRIRPFYGARVRAGGGGTRIASAAPTASQDRKPKGLLDFMIPFLRQLDTLPSAMDPDVAWPNGLSQELGRLVLQCTSRFREERPSALELLEVSSTSPSPSTTPINVCCVPWDRRLDT